LLFIQCASCAEKFEGCCSPACKETIHLPTEQQEALRKGVEKGLHVFNKARGRRGQGV